MISEKIIFERNIMKRKNGFTLAETLITMGIIAVIAAIMIPMLVKSRPNKEMIMLKKAYYLTARNVNELVNDDDFYPDTDDPDVVGFANTVTEATYHGETYTGDTKFCNLFASRMNITTDVNCDATLATTFTSGSKPLTSGTFVTADGMVWVLPKSNFATQQTIYIDVNGDKGDNCFPGACGTDEEPDRFQINVDKYGKITVPAGIQQKYLSTSSVSKSYSELKD